ncbi:11726_t:CDS:1 [Ambispora gerdemannii]|uniref:11726_t:CDS:1 n=1 Tax=Ambispora gerdemannii TaxID=144530 RepID=A0A9N9BUH5_9GLOM|nr:11726_t:CDS:1 [Ambispora gerdemannii]
MTSTFTCCFEPMDWNNSDDNKEKKFSITSNKNVEASIPTQEFHVQPLAKLARNTFIPVGFEIAEEIFGYLEVEDLIAVSLTYKAVYYFINSSQNLWKNMYRTLTPENTDQIMTPLIMIQTMVKPQLKPAVAWKRQVFSRLRYRPFYIAYSYLDDPEDFTLMFHGASYDYPTAYQEAIDYGFFFYGAPGSPTVAKYVEHKGQSFDELQEGFDNWRIAVESIKPEFKYPLETVDGDELYLVYTYLDVQEGFQFTFDKLFDDERTAIEYAAELADPEDVSRATYVDHNGEKFDSKHRDVINTRVAVDVLPFWRKREIRRFDESEMTEETKTIVDDENEEMNVEGKLDDFSQIWRGDGKLNRNATCQELLQSILAYRNTGNSRKRTLEEAMNEMSIKGYVKKKKLIAS